MLVKQEFGQRAEHDGVFRASITFTDSWLQDRFLRVLGEACHKHGVKCGYNSLDDGYDLGFASQQDHDAVMAELQTALHDRWDEHVRVSKYREERARLLLKQYGLSSETALLPDDKI